jgi:membrane protein implicated in regulation of membrane protease activity
MPTLTSLGIWNWFIVGGILLAIEVMAPGSFMLWLGLSALLVGVISLVIDWPWQAQFVAFAFFAIVSIPIWHRVGRRMGKAGDQPFLNRRHEALVGRVFMLERPIVNGAGTIRVGDTVWRVTGPDQPAGNRVKITGSDGGTLMVERTDA